MNNKKLISLSVTAFLQSVLDLEITAKLDKLAFIRSITNNHEPKLLHVFLDDINSLINKEREHLEWVHSQKSKPHSPSGPIMNGLWKYQEDLYNQSIQEAQTKKKSPAEISNLIEEVLEPLFEIRALVEVIINELEIVPNAKFDDKRNIVLEMLKPFSGTLKNERILTTEAFEYLVDVTTNLVNKEELPAEFLKIRASKISAIFIIYTFYRLFEKLYSGHNKDLRNKWFQFIKNSFDNLNKWGIASIRSSFGTKPDSYDYDLKRISYPID